MSEADVELTSHNGNLLLVCSISNPAMRYMIIIKETGEINSKNIKSKFWKENHFTWDSKVFFFFFSLGLLQFVSSAINNYVYNVKHVEPTNHVSSLNVRC